MIGRGADWFVSGVSHLIPNRLQYPCPHIHSFRQTECYQGSYGGYHRGGSTRTRTKSRCCGSSPCDASCFHRRTGRMNEGTRVLVRCSYAYSRMVNLLPHQKTPRPRLTGKPCLRNGGLLAMQFLPTTITVGENAVACLCCDYDDCGAHRVSKPDN